MDIAVLLGNLEVDFAAGHRSIRPPTLCLVGNTLLGTHKHSLWIGVAEKLEERFLETNLCKFLTWTPGDLLSGQTISGWKHYFLNFQLLIALLQIHGDRASLALLLSISLLNFCKDTLKSNDQY